MAHPPLTLQSFARAIVHIDGDAFFAACEQSRRPQLQGRPVVTGKERGIATSMSYEAKARGVTRGMRLSEIGKRCPEAVILPSDYETYSLLSQRFFAIVRRYTPENVQSCFENIPHGKRMAALSRRIADEKVLQLMKAFLTAGYLEDRAYHKTYSGTPKGGSLSVWNLAWC